ncbi:endolytic transglycosylase MltG [Flavihumibacter fluvii]|uniref:endolytic transglycosylase MltG n=1 Tax=Flavihumibacter fluvii TaxID=2838157 RepID=UPI001BDF1469|nr:endolytic transglycosylase MltG [Flavihumibacter fluvii]ULQ54392.1 endolytic transglycosylase MltG [Flavihumibacter fluvii]
MKRVLLFIILALILMAGFISWSLVGPATAFEGKSYALLIHTGTNYETVLSKLKEEKVIINPAIFNLLARQLGYPEKVKAGRYLIQKGNSLITILRKLRNGQQDPVNLVITKLRTKEDFAGLAGRKFEFDSASFIRFLDNNDSVARYALDTNTVMTAILPDTYTYFWNTTPSRVMEKIVKTSRDFWTSERLELARSKGFTPAQVVILASIVDEETNKKEDKGNIASVYINRMNKGMKLGADPTVKFALRDFGLKRIYNKHLAVESPYNTYRVAGLPPGPICTPQRETIDAVLHAPATNYLFFVAKSDFSGYHVFAETYEQHLQFAKAYQLALDNYLKSKSAGEDNGNKP